MQTDLNTNSVTSSVQNTTQSLENPGFDQMAQSLSNAISEFSEESPAMFSSIVAALRPIGNYSMKALNSATGFVRRHPVQIAAGVVAIGFVGAYLMRKGAQTAAPVSSDGRQY